MSKHLISFLVVVAASLVAARPAMAQKIPPAATNPSKALAPKIATGVGSVNLQKILAVLGLAQQLEQRRQVLEEQVLAIQKAKQSAFDLKRKAIGDKPNEEQARELQKIFTDSQDEVKKVRDQAEKQLKELNDYALNVLKRKAAAPIAAVAEKRGLAIIMLEPSPTVVYRAVDADITDDVLDIIRRDDPDVFKGAPQLEAPTEPKPTEEKSPKLTPGPEGKSSDGSAAPSLFDLIMPKKDEAKPK